MKVTLETSKLQELVSKSMKGVSNNKMIPITGLIAVKVSAGRFIHLVSTDATNYFYVSDKIDTEGDFDVVVQADIFSKLIARLTCDKVSLEVADGILNVYGNGKYSIELPLDEEGELIKYPDPLNKFLQGDYTTTNINKSDVDAILNTAKSALAVTNELPCYTGYYIGNKVVATDTFKICGIDTELFEEPKLIASSTLDLVGLLSGSTINVLMNEGDEIVFMDDECNIYSRCMDCFNDYQIDVISELLDEDFDSVIKISKSALLQSLDRLSLFVGIYDKNAVNLTFEKDALAITSKQVTGADAIPYQMSERFKPFTCAIDIEMFQSQVKANTGDVITLHYGKDNAIKLTNGNVTQIVALMEE